MGENLTQTAASFWASIVARSWEDETFKAELLQDPKGALTKWGYGEFRDSNGQEVKIKVEEATSAEACTYDPQTSTLTIYLTPKPDCLNNLRFEGTFTAGCAC